MGHNIERRGHAWRVQLAGVVLLALLAHLTRPAQAGKIKRNENLLSRCCSASRGS